MNRIKQIGKYGICWCCVLLTAGFVQAQAGKTSLQFVNKVGVAPLVRDSSYTNAFGETFTVRNFKYYVSHFQAGDAAGHFTELTGATFLVDAANPAGNLIAVPGFDSRTRYIRFLVGVDSNKNVSGVHTGVLDPARGMFWTWNSGYVMAKLEGKSASSKAQGNYYTYHVGGYKAGQSVARWITLPLPEAAGRQQLLIVADVLQWFKAIHDIRITVQPVCHEPGNLALQLADNYATMFSLQTN
jgi:hypothetical protein